MKKVGILLLLLVMTVSIITTAWATSSNLEEKIKNVKIYDEIGLRGLSLEEVLDILSKQSGIRIIPVPEVAGLKVDFQIAANQTLEEALAKLAAAYGLTFQMNDKENTIVMLKGLYAKTESMNVRMKMPGTFYSDDKIHREVMVRNAAPSSFASMGSSNYQSIGSFNTEEYKTIHDNSFQNAIDTPLSTFSIDVDTASYSNLRRFINNGKLPPVDAVRTEEMINYFTYEYLQPQGKHPFSLTTEMDDCPWNPNHKLVMIGLQGKNIPAEELLPSNLVFLIDVSGSMGESNRLPLLKTAFKMLVKELREEDKVSIVVYSGRAGVILEPTAGSEKKTIMDAIDHLHAGGSTAGGEGIQLAYKIAQETLMREGNNRVILATDGDFNVGVSSESELMKLIEERRNDGIFLSVLGFGMGNIKDNKMEVLADKGNGNYAYIDNALEAKKVMINQLAGTLYTIAKDVKMQVEFNPAQVKSYRLIGYENRILDKTDFNNDKKDAGDMGASHSVTALYEIVPTGSKEVRGSVDPLIYQQSQIVPSDEVLQVKIRYKKPTEDTSILFTKAMGDAHNSGLATENFRFAAAVAEYAMLLRNSEFKGKSSYKQVLERARGARGEDKEGYRAEFIRLVELSQVFDEK